jgi:hypothetical protein
MRFRFGLAIGFGVGYYLGAKAGRQRYEQLRALLQKVRRSDAFETASGKAHEVVDVTKDKAKEFAAEHRPGAHHDDPLVTLGATGI